MKIQLDILFRYESKIKLLSSGRIRVKGIWVATFFFTFLFADWRTRLPAVYQVLSQDKGSLLACFSCTCMFELYYINISKQFYVFIRNTRTWHILQSFGKLENCLKTPSRGGVSIGFSATTDCMGQVLRCSAEEDQRQFHYIRQFVLFGKQWYNYFLADNPFC